MIKHISLPFLFLLFLGCTSVNYNILTGEENLTFISEEKEVKLGRKFSKKVEEDFEIIKDPRYRNIVNEIGYKLVKFCDRKGLVYYFEAIDFKEDMDPDQKNPNAFALPGGYIYINKQLLDMLDGKDEIAAVIAHELSHIVLRHNILKLQEALGIEALLIILSTTGNDARTVKNSQAGLILLMLTYSKERELEADILALKYMDKAGIKTCLLQARRKYGHAPVKIVLIEPAVICIDKSNLHLTNSSLSLKRNTSTTLAQLGLSRRKNIINRD